MSTLTVQNLTGVSPTNLIRVASGHKLYAPGGVVQVVSARNGDYFSSSSTSWVDITGLSLTITPTSTSSKIFIMLSFGRATTALNNLDYACAIRVLGNGSDALAINGNTSSNRPKIAMNVNGLAFNGDHSPGGWMCSALESPTTTSTITYKAQVICQSATYAFIMNGTATNRDATEPYNGRGQSSLTAWEIAQ